MSLSGEWWRRIRESTRAGRSGRKRGRGDPCTQWPDFASVVGEWKVGEGGRRGPFPRNLPHRPRRMVSDFPFVYTKILDAATRNRYRLRLREAVRDPSAPLALLASVRMTRVGRRDLEPVPASLARSCPRSFRSARVARFGQDDIGSLSQGFAKWLVARISSR